MTHPPDGIFRMPPDVIVSACRQSTDRIVQEAAHEIERLYGWLRYIAQASNDEGSCAQQALTGARVPPGGPA